MRYIKSFESVRYNRNIQFKLDAILDKINKDGIDSLSSTERDFIDSFKDGKEEDSYNKLNRKVYRQNQFEFILDRIDTMEGSKKYHGTLKMNDNEFTGYIIYTDSGLSDPHFEDDNGQTLWDYADNFEYELDDFIDYITSDDNSLI